MYSNNPVTEEKAYDLINGCMYFLISLKNLWCYLVSKYSEYTTWVFEVFPVQKNLNLRKFFSFK